MLQRSESLTRIHTSLPHAEHEMRRSLALLLIIPAALLGQQRRTLTTADYDRAVRMLGPTVNPLVIGGTVQPTWLPDGRFWYRNATDSQAVVIDPSKKTRELMATPPAGGVTGGGRGGRGGGGRGGGRGGGVAVNKTCGPNVTGVAGPTVNPPASMSPDGSKAVFICDWNLWVYDVATGQSRALTTDGATDFGYATSNAGWTGSAAPSLACSPRSEEHTPD